MQKVSHKAFVMVIDGRIGEIHVSIKMRHDTPPLLILEMNQWVLLQLLGNVVDSLLLTKNVRGVVSNETLLMIDCCCFCHPYLSWSTEFFGQFFILL